MTRILVVDDDERVRQGLRKALEANGHLVFEAGDGSAAVRLIETEQIDLVITDMHMPNMDGIEVVTLLGERKDRPKILAMSGGVVRWAGEEVLLDAKLLGADQILQKPFTLQKLYYTVDKILNERAE